MTAGAAAGYHFRDTIERLATEFLARVTEQHEKEVIALRVAVAQRQAELVVDCVDSECPPETVPQPPVASLVRDEATEQTFELKSPPQLASRCMSVSLGEDAHARTDEGAQASPLPGAAAHAGEGPASLEAQGAPAQRPPRGPRRSRLPEDVAGQGAVAAEDSKGRKNRLAGQRTLSTCSLLDAEEGGAGPMEDGQIPKRRASRRRTPPSCSLTESALSGDESPQGSQKRRKARRIPTLAGRGMPIFELRPPWALDEAELDSLSRSISPDMLFVPHQSHPRARMLAEARLGRSGGRCIIHPQSRSRLCWDLIAMLLLFFDFVVIPLQVLELPPSHFLRAMEWVVLIYWSLDIAASLSTGTYINGLLVLEHKTIIRKYSRTWMPFDLVVMACEYFVIILELLDDIQTDDTASSVGLMRLVRGTRVMRFLRFMRLLRIVKVDKIFNEMKNRINNNLAILVLSICRLLLGITVLIHVLACAWYAIGKLSAGGWVRKAGLVSKPFGMRYLDTFQWSMARLHPSTFGEYMTLETDSERVFGIIVSLMALGGGGAFVSSITNTMAQLNHFCQQRTHKLWVTRQYVREHNISVQLAVRVKKYIEKSLSMKLREQNASELAEMLPATLMIDLHFEAWMPFIAGAEYFSSACRKHPRAVWCLCRDALQESSYVPGDTVFSTGDVCDRMFFVSHGAFIYMVGAVMGQSATPHNFSLAEEAVSQLRPGQPICEMALWTTWTSVGELSASDDGTCLVLHAGHFARVMNDHNRALPEAVKRGQVVVDWINDNLDSLSDILPSISDDDIWVQTPSKKSTRSSGSSFSSFMPFFHSPTENSSSS